MPILQIQQLMQQRLSMKNNLKETLQIYKFFSSNSMYSGIKQSMVRLLNIIIEKGFLDLKLWPQLFRTTLLCEIKDGLYLTAMNSTRVLINNLS